MAHVSFGEMFRSEIDRGTELGKIIAPYVASRQLVPSQYIFPILQARLSQPDTAGGVLFDGYPRNIEQLAEFEEALKGLSKKIDGVVHLDFSDDEVMGFILDRRVCSSCGAPFSLSTLKDPLICPQCSGKLVIRKDDEESTARKGLDVYRQQTGKVVAALEERGLVFSIQGRIAPDDAAQRVLEVLVAPELFVTPADPK